MTNLEKQRQAHLDELFIKYLIRYEVIEKPKFYHHDKNPYPMSGDEWTYTQEQADQVEGLIIKERDELRTLIDKLESSSVVKSRWAYALEKVWEELNNDLGPIMKWSCDKYNAEQHRKSREKQIAERIAKGLPPEETKEEQEERKRHWDSEADSSGTDLESAILNGDFDEIP